MKITKTIKTFWCRIYCGIWPGYKAIDLRSPDFMLKAKEMILEFCTSHSIGATVSETWFYYPRGREPGVIVELTDYPRFPSSPGIVEKCAIELANTLCEVLEQERCTIMTPTANYLIEREGCESFKETTDV